MYAFDRETVVVSEMEIRQMKDGVAGGRDGRHTPLFAGFKFALAILLDKELIERRV